MDQEINELEKTKKYEKLNKIIEEHCKNTDEAAKNIINLLKEDCKTHGDLMIKINRLKFGIPWERIITVRSLINRCEELVKEEMNGLKPTIHS